MTKDEAFEVIRTEGPSSPERLIRALCVVVAAAAAEEKTEAPKEEVLPVPAAAPSTRLFAKLPSLGGEEKGKGKR